MLRPHLNSRTKVIVLNSPCNPTGCVYSKGMLQEIATMLEEPQFAHISVLSDEMYDRLTYDNTVHTSFAALPNMWERTITINGFSKNHAMTGLRLGFLCAPLPIAAACAKLQTQVTSCANSVSQRGLTRSFKILRRSVILSSASELAKLSKIKFVKPLGAFYCLPDVSTYFNEKHGVTTSGEFCQQLLKSQQLALVPGEAFEAPGTIRLCFAADLEDLRLACAKLAAFVEILES